MRYFLILVVSLLISNVIISQTITRINYNNKWEITDSPDFSFFRIAIYDQTNKCFTGNVTDYYADSTVEMIGNYSGCQKNGEFFFYYPNGKEKKVESYLNNRPYGEWIYFFPNGQIHQKIQFTGIDFSLLEYYDSLGNNLADISPVKWSHAFIEPNTNDTILISGNFKDGQKNGLWYWKWKDGTKIITKNYKKGKLLKNDYADRSCYALENAVYYDNGLIPEGDKFLKTERLFTEKSESFYVMPETMPIPIAFNIYDDPITKFNNALAKELGKFSNATEDSIIINLKYQVSENGKVEVLQITCDNEELRTTIVNYLKNPKWKAGIYFGRKVSITFTGQIAINREKINVDIYNMVVPLHQ